MLMLGWLIPGIVVLVTGMLMLPSFMKILSDHGIEDTNYQQANIPTACGLLMWLLFILTYLIVQLMSAIGGAVLAEFLRINRSLFAEYGFALSIVAFVGFLDDAVGVKTCKGFAGHWQQWKQRGMISTGLLKAIGISVAAVLILLSESAPSKMLIMPFLLIVFMTNGMNLLDTRPGRALKGFWSLTAVLLGAFIVTGEGKVWMETAWLMLPVLIGAAILLVPDLKGKLMLGDTGANLLGFTLGSWIVFLSGPKLQAALLCLLLILHVVTWRLSLSKLIERSRFLMWLDSLGRGRPDKI